ncbi:MAG: S66 peptidase family protein [Patescibacteria group bacterium]
MGFSKLTKLKQGDKVAIFSPSFAASRKWPHVHELGLKRIVEIFGLVPVEYPTTRKIGSTKGERSKDLIDSFSNPDIKAIISTLGGNDQVTYIKNLPSEVFVNNPKPFFGYSDNTHLENFLWLNNIPSYYGGALFTQFALEGKMDDFTIKYLKEALFEEGETELEASEVYNDIGLNWNDPQTLTQDRVYEKNDGWFWDGSRSSEGISWGGCLESIDEILRHRIKMPSLKQFENIILFTETSEEIPPADYVFRVYRALGERGILERIKGVLVGRPKAWEFDKQNNAEEKDKYREKQRETILNIVRTYNKDIPIVQNLDFGHTNPQICLPHGKTIKINASKNKIFADF